MLKRRAQKDDTEELSTSVIQHALKYFNIVSFNLSGVNAESVPSLLAHLKLETNFQVMLLQEVSNHVEMQVIQTSCATVWIFPGHSSSSRSNAIAISYEWAPQFLFADWNVFAGVVVLDFGEHALVCFSAHLPYDGHR